MTHLYLGLFYEADTTMNQRYQKQILFLSLILLRFFGIFVKKNQKGL